MQPWSASQRRSPLVSLLVRAAGVVALATVVCAPTASAEPRLALNLHEGICMACGGLDQQCGGLGDLTPDVIGFAATCPSVTIPGQRVRRPVTDLADCVVCLTEFDADCLDAIAVLALKPYPLECGGAATPQAGW